MVTLTIPWSLTSAVQRPDDSANAADPFGIHQRFVATCADMSTDQLAGVLDISTEQAEAIIDGRAELTADAVTRLCTRAGISPLWMLAGIGPRSAAELPGYLLRSGERKCLP